MPSDADRNAITADRHSHAWLTLGHHAFVPDHRDVEAREVYALVIGEPGPDDSRDEAADFVGAVVGVPFALLTGSWFLDGTKPKRQAVRIVEIASGRSLVSWVESGVDLRLLAERISDDLNRLDANTFASDWGLDNP